MFNRSSFDRTLYSRRSSFDSVEAALRGSGNLKVGLVVQVHVTPFELKGKSTIQNSPRFQQKMSIDLHGSSSLGINNFRMQLRFTSNMHGAGQLEPGIGMLIPLGEIDMLGKGALEDKLMYIHQNIIGGLTSHGLLSTDVLLRVNIDDFELEGSSGLAMSEEFKLLMPLIINLGGSGDSALRRIGALNSDTFELTGLNLQPGQTLIIDTDELNVLIDNIEDVDSVTSDSVFFQLQPGENELTFLTNHVNPNLSVTVIWQNRWL